MVKTIQTVETKKARVKTQSFGLPFRVEWQHLVLMLIIVLAVGLRWNHLYTQSFWIDEVDEATTARADFNHFLDGVRYDDGAAPLDYLGVKLVVTIFRDQAQAARLWSFGVSCVAVWLMYMVGVALFQSKITGLLASLLLALSSYHILYAQEARFYAFTTLIVGLNIYFFHKAFVNGTGRHWLYFSLVVALCLYTHYFLVLLLMIEALLVGLYWLGRWLQTRTKALLKQGAAQVILAAASLLGGLALFAPWLIYATLKQLNQPTFTYPPIPSLDLSFVMANLSYLTTLNYGSPEPLLAFVMMLALTGFVWGVLHKQWIVLVLMATMSLAVPFAWIADSRSHYFWNARQVILILPPLYLLAAAGIVYLAHLLTPRNWEQRAKAKVGFSIFLGVMVASLSLAIINRAYPDTSKEDWRGVSAFIAANVAPDTHIYTQLNSHFSYGVGYYQPTLLDKGRDLGQFIVGDKFDSLTAIQKYDFKPNDWVVLLNRLDIANFDVLRLNDYFSQQSWGQKTFLGLTAYCQCLSSAKTVAVLNLPHLQTLAASSQNLVLSPPLTAGQQYGITFSYPATLEAGQLTLQIQFLDVKNQEVNVPYAYDTIDVSTTKSKTDPYNSNRAEFNLDFLVPPNTFKTQLIFSNMSANPVSFAHLQVSEQIWVYHQNTANRQVFRTSQLF